MCCTAFCFVFVFAVTRWFGLCCCERFPLCAGTAESVCYCCYATYHRYCTRHSVCALHWRLTLAPVSTRHDRRCTVFARTALMPQLDRSCLCLVPRRGRSVVAVHRAQSTLTVCMQYPCTYVHVYIVARRCDAKRCSISWCGADGRPSRVCHMVLHPYRRPS